MVGNDTLEHQTNGLYNDSEKIICNASQDQFIENNNDEEIRGAVDNAVMTLENCMQDAIWKAMNKMVIPRVEMVVTSITGSSGHGPNSIVQDPDPRDFTGNNENTPLMSASSRLNQTSTR